MKKEIECKVVEDLLFGYVDKTLNNESKKMVENHLKDCKDCKEKPGYDRGQQFEGGRCRIWHGYQCDNTHCRGF